MALFSKTNTADWLGLDTTGGRICVAHVSRPGGKPRLHRLQCLPTLGVESASLSQLRQSAQFGRHRCITALPAEAYQFLQIEAPGVPPEELKEAVRWRIKDMIDFPPEQAVLDVLPLPSVHAPAGRQPAVFAVVAARQSVQDCVRRYQHARIPLQAIDVAELAQRNLAALFEEPGRAMLTLSVTAGGGLLTITSDGELYAFRHIDTNLPTLIEATEERRSQQFDRLVLELQRSMDSFDRLFSHLTLSHVLLLPMPGLQGLQEYLAQNLYLPVVLADLAKVIDGSAVQGFHDASMQASGLLAIGLALREE